VTYPVRRLVRFEKIVRRKVFSESRFDNTFDDFREIAWRMGGSLRVVFLSSVVFLIRGDCYATVVVRV